MKTYLKYSKEGKLIGFEINNTLFGRRSIEKLLLKFGAEVTWKPKWYTFVSDGIYFKFVYKNQEFLCWEPFNDNSRYWIGPSDNSNSCQAITEEVHEFFSLYRLWFFILTDKLKKWFKNNFIGIIHL